MVVKNTFQTGDALTASDVNNYLTNGGLVYVGTQTLSSVTNTISSVFSSAYDNYYVKINGFYSNGTNTRAITLRIGTDATSTYTWGQRGTYPSGAAFDSCLASQTGMDIGSSSNQVQGQSLDLWINSPYLAAPTTLTGSSVTYQANTGTVVFRSIFGHHNVSSSFTGFQIIGATDNLVGTVRVYGCRQA